MKENEIRSNHPTFVLKAAQSIWAANKYFVLACSQNHYKAIREYLRPEINNFDAAYTLMKEIEDTYHHTPSAQLPQITNALYHMAGYFKQLVSNEDRRYMGELIPINPSKALQELDRLTRHHNIEYLLHTRLFEKQRKVEFNNIPTSLRHHGVTYPPYTLWWINDEVICRY